MANGETEYFQTLHKRSHLEALDELHREFNVRARCFKRWVADGRLSRTDAQDRIDRLATAIDIVEATLAAESQTNSAAALDDSTA